MSNDIQLRFQNLCDQSKIEQLILIRTKISINNRLQTYINHGHKFSLLIDEFVNRISVQVSKQMKELEKNSDCIKQLLYCLEKAEKCRLTKTQQSKSPRPDSTSNASSSTEVVDDDDEDNDQNNNTNNNISTKLLNQSINTSQNQYIQSQYMQSSHNVTMPMDALARGFLGSEIAELINSFRFYKEDIDLYLTNYIELLNIFSSNFHKELSHLKYAKEQISKTIS